MFYSRRDLGKLAIAAVPLAGAAKAFGAAAPMINSKIKGVQIGAITYSFRQMKAEEVIPAFVSIGLGECELMSDHCEALAGAPAQPAFGGGGRGGPGGPGGGRGTPPSPEEQAKRAEARKASMEALTKWRMSTSPATFKGVKKQFNDAGINVEILCFNQRMTATDDEIDYAFQMAKALEVKAISCSSTIDFAKRVAPFADKHKIIWAGHGHDDVKNPQEFSSPDRFETIMSFSKYIGVNLDIGHFTAAGFDAVEYMKKIHSRITNIHLKDRKKPAEGVDRPANLPWGEGDTPIKAVLQTMAKEKYTFPANIELEYRIPEGSDPVAESKKCFQYCKDALA